ncbi:hypothetical protein D3C78_1694120 [compost metagenome]
MIGFGVFNIDFHMGDIQIAANDNRLLKLQLVQIVQKTIFPLQAKRQSGQVPPGVGRINVYQIIMVVFQRNDAAFGLAVFLLAVMDR